MNYSKKIIIAISVLLSSMTSTTIAQNIYYSQYHHAPQLTNPASVATTNYMSVMLNYRKQWANVGDGYTTPSLAAAYPILLGNQASLRMAGVGLTVLQDRTGQNGYVKTTGAMLNYAHNLRVNNDMFLAMGLQGGYFHRILDENELTFGNQWQNNVFDPNAPTNENLGNDGKGFLLVNTGVIFYRENAEGQQNFSIGAAIYNLNQPKTGNTFENKLSRNITLSASLLAWENNKFSISPSTRFVRQSNKSQQFNIGSLFHYHSPNRAVSVGLGTWYSVNNAFITSLELNLPNYVIGISYDFVISSLKNNNKTGGAPEFALAWRKILGKGRGPRQPKFRLESKR
jgi:type IX secretion system PorP/SprF family membrane protein